MVIQHWRYLGEGNANVVFCYIGPAAGDLSDTVLRLRKKSLLSSYTVQEHEDYLRREVLPCLSDLGQFVLCGKPIPPEPYLLDHLRDVLRESCDQRPGKFRDSSLDDRQSDGLCLPWLQSSDRYKVIEFKPKWLAQSPDAPADATMCRTCAIRHMRAEKTLNHSRFCPLDLTHDLSRAINAQDLEKDWKLDPEEKDAVVDHLFSSQLFDRLKSCQSDPNADLTLLMTLRDCSVYIQIDRVNQSVAAVWLADFDRKSPRKQHIWDKLESRLSDEGWYHGRGLREGERSCLSPEKEL